MFHERFMGTEQLWQILWGQKWSNTAHRDKGVPGGTHGDKGSLGTVHRNRGVPGIIHWDRDSPGIIQEVALANLTRIEVVLEELMGTELASVLFTGTGWPRQTF